ncbi:TPR repeat-containing protein [Microseira wollei NIES-4236]|uniref:TPR repeat-containing protein n=2 Tax=Microseira wollei TaxID=467598 RepID=A0AAV3WJS5_9CYAN|nr:TPR repeat-containing protein [Microseira wollei NIES-4236]
MVYGYWDKICNSNWTLKDWLKNLKQAGGYAAVHLKPKDILDINAENLSVLIGNKLKPLFILILLSTESEPIINIKKSRASEALTSNSMKIEKRNLLNQMNLDFNFEDDYVNGSQKSINKINHVVQKRDDLDLAQQYLDAEKYFSPKSIKEAKERITISIARRQGHSKFRQTLLEAYNYRCAITGCDAQEALEAAHIIPYIETENNHPSNGLLLRADLHTLFDLNLITIDPEMMRIHLAPDLHHTSYRDLHGKPLQLPKNKAYLPKKEALKWRCYHCGWYR